MIQNTQTINNKNNNKCEQTNQPYGIQVRKYILEGEGTIIHGVRRGEMH